jgi:hypothetical protein
VDIARCGHVDQAYEFLLLIRRQKERQFDIRVSLSWLSAFIDSNEWNENYFNRIDKLIKYLRTFVLFGMKYPQFRLPDTLLSAIGRQIPTIDQSVQIAILFHRCYDLRFVDQQLIRLAETRMNELINNGTIVSLKDFSIVLEKLMIMNMTPMYNWWSIVDRLLEKEVYLTRI